MNPIPKPIANRWRQMWHPDADDERPWWRWTPLPVRCDGAMLPPSEGWVTPAEGIADYDREHSLPAPPPMSGQVWAYEDGDEITVTSIVGGRAHFGASQRDVFFAWPPTGAVLVSGPTPWGRDIPWAPGEVTNA